MAFLAKLTRILRIMGESFLDMFRLPGPSPAFEAAVAEALDEEELAELFPVSRAPIPFALHEGKAAPSNLQPADLVDFFRYHGGTDGVVSSTMLRAMVYHYHLPIDALSVMLQSTTDSICCALNLGQDYRSHTACRRAARFAYIAEALRQVSGAAEIRPEWLEDDAVCCTAIRAIYRREMCVLPRF